MHGLADTAVEPEHGGAGHVDQNQPEDHDGKDPQLQIWKYGRRHEHNSYPSCQTWDQVQCHALQEDAKVGP